MNEKVSTYALIRKKMALRAMVLGSAVKVAMPPYCSYSSARYSFKPSSLPLVSKAFFKNHIFADHFSLKKNGSRNSSVISQSTEVSAPTETTEAPVEDIHFVDGLDIRVGRIIKAWKHPEADSLYVEEVDVAEEEGPRTICSGLVKYIPEEELQGRPVLVLTNLKPRNMRGVKSNGMLLAASDAAHENVELLDPPEGSVPGDRVWFGDEAYVATQEAPVTPNQLQKKKIWESCQPKLKVNADGEANYDNRIMRTNSGVITSKTLRNANVS